MELNAMCRKCVYDKQVKRVSAWTDEAKRKEYIARVEQMIKECPPGEGSPYLAAAFGKLYEEFTGIHISYAAEKKKFNRLVLRMEDRLRDRIEAASDPLAEAMQLARIGNYIDFSALAEVREDEFMALFERESRPIEAEPAYRELVSELAHAHNLLYLMDNCGEIVIDKLVVEQLKKAYPQLDITVMVRGEEIINDATMEDAEEVGLTSIVRTVDNGSGVAGTDVLTMDPEAVKLLDEAEVILSKGQANYECLHGGKERNIYYSFLCKCQWFTDRFAVEPLTGLFVHEGITK